MCVSDQVLLIVSSNDSAMTITDEQDFLSEAAYCTALCLVELTWRDRSFKASVLYNIGGIASYCIVFW